LAIHPYENFPKEYSTLIAKNLKEFYGFKEVIILPSQKLSQAAYTTVNTSRYRADSILHILDRNTDLDKYDFILALTEKDISSTKNKEPKARYKDWGIFGLGQRPGQCCVVSIFRLGKGKVTNEIFLDRFVKICCHEIGHNLGLPHCPTKGCFMQDANETINTIDDEKLELCAKCKGKLER
jgi:archaemetzincin